MAQNPKQWTEATVHVAGSDLRLIKGGAGRPLLVLHDELGHPGWLQWHCAMANTHTLYIPVHPGFGPLPRVGWISNVRDDRRFVVCQLTAPGR